MTTTTTTTTATAGLAAPQLARASSESSSRKKEGFIRRGHKQLRRKRGTMVVRVHASSSSSSSSGTEEEEEEEERVVALKAARDDAALGCSSCYFPREKDRANDIAFASKSALQRTPRFGTALVVGAETGEVAERLLGAEEDGGGGAKWATVADVSPKQLDRAQEKVPDVGISGNEKGAKYVELSEMSFEEIKPYFGPFDVIVFNDTFEEFPKEKRKETVARAANLLKQTTTHLDDEVTSRIIISSRETKEGDESYERINRDELNALVEGMPLAWSEEEAKRGKVLDLTRDNSNSKRTEGDVYDDDNDLDATRVLYLTQNYKLAKPLHMRAKVVRGFGRGSAEMGLPTANLDPTEVSQNWQKDMNDDSIDIKNIPMGVYFGYCQLEGDDSGKKVAVLNVGRRPSFVDKKDYENDVTVEVHCVEKNEDRLAFDNGKKQFYGETLSVECLGFVRPEMKFNGLDELVTRIKTDVGLSKNSLMKMGI